MTDTTQAPLGAASGSSRGPSGCGPSWAARPSSTPSTPRWCGRSPTTRPTTCPGPTSGPSWSRPARIEHSPSRGDGDRLRRARRRARRRGRGAGLPGVAHRGASRPRAVPSGTRMDEWLEEDEPVYVHPRSPYTRVDILASTRRVQVSVDGVELADSSHPHILFETGLPPRYYLPLADLRTELLVAVGHAPANARTRARRRTGRCRSGTRATTTSSGSTAARCPRAPRSRGWPASTTRRSTSSSTACPGAPSHPLLLTVAAPPAWTEPPFRLGQATA